MQVVYPPRHKALSINQDQVVADRARCSRSRKERDRLAVRLTAAQLESEIEGRAPPNKRQRFYPLLLTERADPTPISAEPEPWITKPALAMVAAVILVLLGHAVQAGFFKWRPSDQAVSTIDHRLAPHLQPMKGTVK